MDSMELNKVIGAVLTAGIAFSALGLVSDKLSHPVYLKESVLQIKGTEAAPAASPAAAAPGLPPLAPLLAKADPAAGEAFTKKICIACHNFQDGGKNKVGPALYGVVGRAKASVAGYTYSAALKAKGGTWTFADLNEWLVKPSAYAPGTKMGYKGIENDQSRANVIDYLRTLSKTPEPLPAVTAADTAQPPATAKSAEEAAPLEVLLAKADPARGQAFTRKICIACHNFAEGGPNKVGPALYGVVGRDKASAPGYTYSAALKGKGGKWTLADLNEWLTKPKAYVPGTKMSYAGIEAPQLRADVVDYLRTLSKDPEPLPGAGETPKAVEKPAAEAPAPAPKPADSAKPADKPPVGVAAPGTPAIVQPAPVAGGTDHPQPSGQAPQPTTGEPPTAPAKPQ